MPKWLPDIVFTNQDQTVTIIRRDAGDVVVDITGFGIRAFFRKDSSSTGTVKEFNTSAGITLSDPSNGEFQLDIDDGDLVAITEDRTAFIQVKYYSGGSITGEGTDFDEFAVKVRTGAANP